MLLHPDYPYPVRKIFLEEDVEIAYMDTGEGDITLVFLHGFASYAPIWQKNIEALRKYYRCLAIDLPGHGLSAKGNFPYTISFYADTVKKWLHLLESKKVVLIGHSMGGQIAIQLVINYPEICSHLILVAPAGFEIFSPAEKILLIQFASAGIIGSSQYAKLVLNLKNYFYNLSEKEYEKLKELNRDFYSLLGNQNLPILLSRSVQGMMNEPVFEDLYKIRLPVLALFGKNDRLIPNKLLHQTSTEKIAQAGAAQIPDCQLKLYEKCGHFLQYEHPARFNIDLYKFLNPQIFDG